METERTLSEKFPQSRQRAEVMLFIARLYESRGESRRALEAYRRVRAEFAGGREADEARWSTGWINYRSGRFTEAYGALKGLYISAPRRAEGDKYLYWAARSAGNLGNGQEASSLYGKVCSEYPRGFYCMLSKGRAGLKAESGIKDGERASRPPRGPQLRREASEAAGVSMASSPYTGDKGASAPDTHYLAAVELLTLGMNKEAAVELKALDGKYPDEREYLIEVAKLFERAGDYYRALRISRRCSPSGPGDETAYKELTGISYPIAVVGEVMEHQAPEARVDPKLVASIMREESEFNPEAVSRTGALGLMQITPATGETIASALMGVEKGAAFDPRGLLTPSTSIRFGSWYLGQLSRKFKGDLILTIAAYNAGPAAASRWAGTRPPEDDEFIESIPYSETRLYVKKVLSSYGEYLRLSGMDRGPLKGRADGTEGP
ncbi:MAG: transglycosylase SLT domain-containing protein [Deltaproteobacteria bacterium]|nr:transglycosylase SLT domain-containing protein [Deltaproteobacteria bacterium]